jgi:hypothetical protein
MGEPLSYEDTSPAAGVVLARPDVSVLRTKRGAWIGVGAASFTVKGAAAFEAVSALLGRSDGSRTGHDLLDEFPAGARPALSRVLEALAAKGCVTFLDAPMSQYIADRGPASEWLIPYFAQLTDEPLRALDRMLTTTVHLYGGPDWLGRLRRLLDASPLFGLRAEFHAVSEEDGLPRWEDAGLVVIDADSLPHERIVGLQDALLDRGVPHGIVGKVGGQHWILWSDDKSTGCWNCLRRYGRTAESSAAAETMSPAPDECTAAAVLHAIYQRSAGLGEHSPAAVAMPLNPGPPMVKQHPAWSVAGCRCHRAVVPPAGGDRRDDTGPALVRRNIVSPDDDSRLDDVHEQIIDVLAGWTDEFAGPFRHLDGGDLPQVPFGQARAAILVGRADQCRVREISAATLSSREALYQAALNAIELYAEQVDGPRPNRAAGWTLDEAIYRALLRRSLLLPADDAELTSVSGHEECVRFSRYIQRGVARAGGPVPSRWFGARLANGIYRVAGHDAGNVLTRGAGACYAEALSTALLRLVNDEGVLVPVNPHSPTWAEVWQHIARPEWVEVTARTVPFARHQVRLVEVR